MWRELFESIAKDTRDVYIQAPASRADIDLVETSLGCLLPDELVSLLLELNGDHDCLMSTNDIIETNLMLREELTACMPLDCLLFFAQNGCGDYYGYGIRKNGDLDSSIFFWDHELDSREWYAVCLKDAILRMYEMSDVVYTR